MHNRLKGNNGSKSPLFQMWTTIRFRMLLKAAATQSGESMSEFARRAIWERAQDILDPKTQARIEREATREETKR